MFDPCSLPRDFNLMISDAKVQAMKDAGLAPDVSVSDEKLSPAEIALPLIAEFAEYAKTHDHPDFHQNFMDPKIVAAFKDIPAIMVMECFLTFLREEKGFQQEDINKVLRVTCSVDAGT